MAENLAVHTVVFLKSASRLSESPDTGSLPELAIAGRSNVGKSSLINRLVNRRQLARVSNTPGRTQLLNFFRVNDAFVLCDLPGYGYAKVPWELRSSWGDMIGGYLERRTPLRALLLLVDCRREPGQWEREKRAPKQTTPAIQPTAAEPVGCPPAPPCGVETRRRPARGGQPG